MSRNHPKELFEGGNLIFSKKRLSAAIQAEGHAQFGLKPYVEAGRRSHTDG
jgi:hypothetical protein